MKHILLPTDFSDNSWNAMSYAFQMYKDEACTFYMLNTYTPVLYHVEYVMVYPAQYGMGDFVRENSLKQLGEFKERAESTFANPNHTIEIKSSFNMLIPEIDDMIKNNNIDFVVMGTQGATGAKEVLFGSNTVHVFKSVKSPVLAVPAGYTYTKPENILFPTDYGVDYQDRHLNLILDMAKLHQSRVNVMHVSFGYELTEEELDNKATLSEQLKPVYSLFHDVSHESVNGAINEFQERSKMNVLAMINNKHSFFENLLFKSTINQIGFNLKIPFLVIPA